MKKRALLKKDKEQMCPKAKGRKVEKGGKKGERPKEAREAHAGSAEGLTFSVSAQWERYQKEAHRLSQGRHGIPGGRVLIQGRTPSNGAKCFNSSHRREKAKAKEESLEKEEKEER